MKNLLKLGMALMIAAMLIGFVGCFEDDGEEEVDYKDYKGSDRAIAFKNGLGDNVVIFAGTITEKTKLGGVRAGATSGLSKSNSPTWFGKTQAFPVVIITEKQYLANKSKLSKIETPITKLYVFYNAQGENNKTYEVDGRLGGNKYYLELTMPVGGTWNVEMRDQGTSGPAIGYAQDGIMHTKLFVQPDKNFNLYPVFHRWNAFTEVVDIVFPKDNDGYAVQLFFSLSQETPDFRYNMSSLLDSLKKVEPNIGAAYIEISNGVTNTMIHLTKGGQPVRNALGVSAFGAGVKTFKIEMNEAIANSGDFAADAGFDGYAIGMDGRENDVVVLRDEDDPDTTVRVKNGWIYTLNVTGNSMTPSGIKGELNLRYNQEGGTGKPRKFDWSKTLN